MKLIDRPVREVLDAFRSSEPTPGGGSAAALAGAVGASLLAMVAALPKPRAATPAQVEQLAASGAECRTIADRLAALVDRDSEAYDLVIGAYRLPKSTDEEKAVRTERIQAALRAAIETPLDVMRACRQAVDRAGTIGELGNASASSDVQVGIELLGAALRGARLNVDINLGSVKDAAYAASVRDEAARLAG